MSSIKMSAPQWEDSVPKVREVKVLFTRDLTTFSYHSYRNQAEKLLETYCKDFPITSTQDGYETLFVINREMVVGSLCFSYDKRSIKIESAVSSHLNPLGMHGMVIEALKFINFKVSQVYLSGICYSDLTGSVKPLLSLIKHHPNVFSRVWMKETADDMTSVLLVIKLEELGLGLPSSIQIPPHCHPQAKEELY